jgi:outer membrane protein TolC
VNADARIEVEKKNIQLAENRRKQSQAFFQAGEVTKVDVLRAETAVKAAQRQLAAAQQGRAIAESDLRAALEGAQKLEFGGVIVNEAPTFRADQMPYGGVKASGNTREGPAYAVRELTEERLVVIQL